MEMNDDRSLESLLQSVPLRSPSLNLDARVSKSLASYRRPQAVHWARYAIAAGVLLAIGISIPFSLSRSRPSPSVIAAQNHIIRLERVTSTVYGDGVIARTDDAAYERFRRRTIREIWYVDPKTHATLQTVIPSEQVLVQKLAMY